MAGYKIVEETRWTLTGRRTTRRIEGPPSYDALRGWRDEGDALAPSIAWLKAALDDTFALIDKMNRP